MVNTADFIKITANKVNLPEEWIMKLVSFQAKTAKEAILTGSTIELSGAGRFVARMNIVEKKKKEFTNYLNAAKRELETYDKEHERWYPTYKKVKGLEADMAFLNNKRVDPTLEKFRSKKNQDELESDTEGSL